MPLLSFASQKSFSDLTEREILALAIQAEEEDSRIYREMADQLRPTYPASAEVFVRMAEEESGHRDRLLDLFKERFGDRIPLIRREDVRGFLRRKPMWMTPEWSIEAIRERVVSMEEEAQNFYRKAAARSSDPSIRKLLDDLADDEAGHENTAERLQSAISGEALTEEKEAARRSFVLQIVQPGLIGLMDGSVSTLAPVFAAAFATQNSWETFLVGMAASIGAGISMGFAEALSDDGTLSGRGKPIIRGLASGLMTAVGGVGHTLPYLIPDFRIATAIAIAVVLVELWAIAWIRARYMDTPFLRAAYQVVVGGLLVFATGILIGSA